MNDTIGRMLSLLLVLNSVAHAVNVPTTASSVGSNDPVVVRVGENATLQCSAEPKEGTCLIWIYNQPSFDHLSSHDDLELTSGNAVIIDHTHNLRRRIAVETNRTVSVLNITDIKSEDAGRYKCYRNDSDDATFSKELIVIDGGPKCSSTVHKDLDNEVSLSWNKMELHCEVGFTASPDATNGCILEWRIVGRKDVLKSECIPGKNSVKATLTLDAASHSNITSYVCVVKGSGVQQYSCKTGQIETPSPECNENVVAVHPGPNAKSTKTKIKPNLRCLLRKQLFRIRSSKDRLSLLLQWRTLRKVSKLVNIQREMLSVESKRLELENSTTTISIEEHGDAKDK